MNAFTRLFKNLIGQPKLPDAAEWAKPIGDTLACGPNLEYDPEYAVLAGRLMPQSEVQYGKFTAVSPEPDWLEVERDARRLLMRSKDITLLLWFTRARTHQAGAKGLLEGLNALRVVLEKFPEDVHPQHTVEGERDLAVRANALAGLCDPEGLLGDVRDIVISGNTLARLSVRDVEMAGAYPRSAYAPDPESIKRQLSDLHQREDANFLALLTAVACLEEIRHWTQKDLGDEAPDLSALLKLLQPITQFDVPEAEPERLEAEGLDALPISEPAPTSTAVAPLHTPWPALIDGHEDRAGQREHIRQLLREVREWVEHNEPSSPISVLLKQAERMWGKRFSEIAHVIPADLLREWDKDDTQA